MKAEKVIITNAPVLQKDKTEEPGWMPDIVKENMDKWLTHEEQLRRRRVVHVALERMVRDGEAQEKTVILPLIENRQVVETPFTFYKIIVQPNKKMKP